MTRFTKKPVTIEALVWTGSNILQMQEFAGDMFEPDYEDKADGYCVIHTLEDGAGDHLASPGDYIIKGVHGEFYPCKPDIFRETYTNEDGSEIA